MSITAYEVETEIRTGVVMVDSVTDTPLALPVYLFGDDEEAEDFIQWWDTLPRVYLAERALPVHLQEYDNKQWCEVYEMWRASDDFLARDA